MYNINQLDHDALEVVKEHLLAASRDKKVEQSRDSDLCQSNLAYVIIEMMDSLSALTQNSLTNISDPIMTFETYNLTLAHFDLLEELSTFLVKWAGKVELRDPDDYSCNNCDFYNLVSMAKALAYFATLLCNWDWQGRNRTRGN